VIQRWSYVARISNSESFNILHLDEKEWNTTILGQIGVGSLGIYYGPNQSPSRRRIQAHVTHLIILITSTSSTLLPADPASACARRPLLRAASASLSPFSNPSASTSFQPNSVDLPSLRSNPFFKINRENHRIDEVF
jgi:hypothetical protein